MARRVPRDKSREDSSLCCSDHSVLYTNSSYWTCSICLVAGCHPKDAVLVSAVSAHQSIHPSLPPSLPLTRSPNCHQLDIEPIHSVGFPSTVLCNTVQCKPSKSLRYGKAVSLTCLLAFRSSFSAFLSLVTQAFSVFIPSPFSLSQQPTTGLNPCCSYPTLVKQAPRVLPSPQGFGPFICHLLLLASSLSRPCLISTTQPSR